VRRWGRCWAGNNGTNLGFFRGIVGRRPTLQAFHWLRKMGKLVRR
jgi:hypothetical protein